MQLRRGDKGRTAVKVVAGAPALGRARALASFWVTAMVGVSLVLLLAFAAGVLVWMEKEDSFGVRQLRSCSAVLVRDLGSRAAGIQGRLRAWAADPQLKEAFRRRDAEALQAKEEMLTALMPSASRVRLLVAGYSGGDEDDGQELSYAGLDLIHQAEQRRQVTPVEVHRLGREDMHLAIAGPVLDDQGGQVLGVVHVSLPPSLLPSAEDAGGDWGRILFQQQVGGEVATVGFEGRGSAPEGEPDYRTDVPGTRLRVVAWVVRSSLLQGDLLFMGLGACGLVLVLVGLALWIPLRGIKNALVLDYAGIVAMAEDAANSKPIRRIKCRLSETQPVVEILTRVLRSIPQARPGNRRPAAGAVPMPVIEPDPGPGSVSPAEPTDRDDAGVEPPEANVQRAAPKPVPVPELGPNAAVVETLDLDDIKLDELAPASGGFTPTVGSLNDVPGSIFRAYDIRGIVGKDLTVELAPYIGLAVGSAAIESNDHKVFIAHDTRPSGIALSESIVDGLRASGCDVIDLGMVPTPLLYFATRYQGETSGVVVTGSHNPAEYNGVKVVIRGTSIEGERIVALRERILNGAFASGNGSYELGHIVRTYIARVENDVAIARTMKLVVDCGNAAASVVAGDLYRALGCDVVEINTDPDAGFPDGRVPDPSRPGGLEALRERVVAENADLGVAFDGDGDRLGVVDSSGKIIWADRVLMLLAADVLSRHPGTDVIYDVKCSHHLAGEILRHGGRPVMWRSGHSPLKAKLAETGALLAGEWSGHIIFQERWYGFDDALYAGARLLEVLALDPRSTSEVFASLPEAISTPELFVAMAEGEAHRVMTSVDEIADRLEGVDVYRVDGLRVELERGWGLVRASNTQPALVFRFEADDEPTLDKVKGLFRKIMTRAAPDLLLPF